MIRTVYLDILLLVNVSVNYFILLAAGKLAGKTAVPKRLALASFLGAVYSCVHFFYPWKITFSPAARLIFGVFMILLAYPQVRESGFSLMAVSFYISSALAAGVAYSFLAVGAKVATWWMMGISLLVLYFVPMAAEAAGYRAGKKLPLFELDVVFLKKNLSLTALLDTANNLRDPISGLPVIVIDWEAVKPLIPEESKGFFTEKWDLSQSDLHESGMGERIRLVPFKTISGEKSLLPAFCPDEITVKTKSGIKFIGKAVMGVSKDRLNPQGLYGALLHPELVNIKVR